MIAMAWLMAGCSPSAPTSATPTGSTAPPVTSAPLATTTSSSTSAPPTSFSLLVDDEEPEVATPAQGSGTPIGDLSTEMIGLLGPVSDLRLALDQLAVFPAGIETPPGAVIVDLSVGVGSPAVDGRVDIQVAATVTTSESSDEAARRLSRSLTAAGFTILDTSESASQRSTSFRVPGGNRFDELVVAVDGAAETTSVRIVYSAPVPSSLVQPFTDWTGGQLPLPEGGDRRTLVVASRSGRGSLETIRWSVETSAVVDRGDLQDEANRLLSRISGSDGPWTSPNAVGEGEDAPLTGPLHHPELDGARYEVVPVQRVGIDRNGELESVPGVEVRLVGERTDG